jgi:hypothetical protein
VDLGALLAESRGPREKVIILGGIFLLLSSLLGFANPWVFLLAAPGLLIVVLGATRPTIRFYERGLTRGRKHLPYESVRGVYDGNPLLHGHMAKGRAFTAAVDSDLMISDGNPFRIIRLQRTPDVYAVLQQRVLPAAVATWRARLERGESYKVANSALELKHNELWAPDPRNPMRPLLLPFRDTRIEGSYAYRGDSNEPVARHGAFGGDLVLRALIASYQIPVA